MHGTQTRAECEEQHLVVILATKDGGLKLIREAGRFVSGMQLSSHRRQAASACWRSARAVIVQCDTDIGPACQEHSIGVYRDRDAHGFQLGISTTSEQSNFQASRGRLPLMWLRCDFC